MGNQTLETRDGFQSKWGFILACIGSAVGMGNIWRFPIMVQKFGGMSFLIPYFLFVVLIGSTGVIEEFALGRRAGAGPVGSFGMCTEERMDNRKIGELIGALPILGSMMLAIGGTFGAAAPEAATLGEAVGMIVGSGIFGVGNGVWLLIGLIASLAIMAKGISSGIEKANKIMMPLLFGLFVCLGFYVCTLNGAMEGYKYIFTLKPASLASPEVWIYAFGQAFFSLSVAGNGSVIYGSYLPKDEDLPFSARNVAVFDTIAALLAALVIIPSMAVVLGEGIKDVGGGPGLMFVYLVNVFNSMPGGRIVGMIFYICVLFAGVSSIINLYEAPVAFLQEKLNMKRIPSVALIGGIGGVVALLIQPWTSQWMDLVSIYICPLGALLAGIMFFWVLRKETALSSVEQGRKAGSKPIGDWFYPLGKYIYCTAALIALIAGAMMGGIG